MSLPLRTLACSIVFKLLSFSKGLIGTHVVLSDRDVGYPDQHKQPYRFLACPSLTAAEANVGRSAVFYPTHDIELLPALDWLLAHVMSVM